MIANHEVLSQPKPTVEIVYAGGTISSLATPQGYREGGHVVDLVGQLEQHMPSAGDTFSLGHTAVAYTGLSENLDDHYISDIGQKVEEALDRKPHSVVVTHGTDSMEQTARALDARFAEKLQTAKAKIILTGANEDLSHPETDAWDNLQFALESAASEAEPGVYVAFHGRLIPADLVVKEPFDGISMNYASREDPDYIEAVRKQGENTQQLIAQLVAIYRRQSDPKSVIDYPVNVIRKDHQELLGLVEGQDVRAVLLTLYHSGTANTEAPAISVAELAKRLRDEKGIVTFAVTENGEPVNFGGYETSIKLQEAGIVPLGDMPHDVALAKLRLIDPGVTGEDLKQEMQNS